MILLDRIHFTTKFRVISAMVITLAIAVIFTASFFRIRLADQIMPIHPITEMVREEIKPLSENVHVGLYIRNFPSFEVVQNRFVMDCIVWFKFNPSAVPLEQLSTFAFLNGEIHRPVLSKGFEPTIRRIGDQVLVFYDMTVDLFSDFSFTYFPYGRHVLTISIMDEDVTPREIVYETDDESFRCNPHLDLATWRIDALKTDFGYEEVELQRGVASKTVRFPIARFHLFFSSTGTKYIVIFFIPLLFALLLALFSLLIPYKMDGDNSYMATLAGGSFAAIIAHRFVIEAMIPKVGEITTTDAVFLLALFIVFVPALFNLIMAIYTRTVALVGDQSVFSARINAISGILFMILAVITIVGLAIIFLA